MSKTNYFKGLIKCKNCGKNYKFKMERKKPTYICSGFANYGKDFCSYFPIPEEELLYFISRHYDKEIKGEEVKEYVSRIEIKGEGYTIHYINGSKSILNANDNIYGVKYRI